MTTFGDGVYQYGGMPVGSGSLPVTGLTASGNGKAFFIHGSLGNDGNSGSAKAPLKTLTGAYALMTDGAGDVAYILNDGGTGASVRDVAVAWAKDNCHIVGLGAPAINQRCRIAPPTTSAVDVDAYTPYLTLSASGCIIQNVSWSQGQSEDAKPSVGILVSGSRNYINNVSVLNAQHANQGDEAATTNVTVTGSENVFDRCYIGSDTAAKSAANTNVLFGAGGAEEATRNIFRDCVFTMFADAATPYFISAPTAFDTQRWNLFDGCSFINTGTSTIAAAVNWADTTGKLFLKDCAFFGMTDVTAADNAYVYMYGISSALGVVDIGHYKAVDIA